MYPLPTLGFPSGVICNFALLMAALAAQSGQIMPGVNLGVSTLLRAGDVDDDGVEDLVFDLGTTWEVRSGATGLAWPALTQSRGSMNEYFGGLLADLDADGSDDLYFLSRTSGLAEFRSGRSGAVLFAFNHPHLRSISGAADHDADGADDVMVVYDDPTNSVRYYEVLSGRGGVVLDTHQFGYSATVQRSVQWVGDVDGDGYVDLVDRLFSFGQTFYTVKAGPDWQRWLLANSSGSAWKAFDTNADGRDDLLTDFGYLDVVTAQLVWPGSFQQASPMDLDGDGAMDIFHAGQALSGRTHAPFAGTLPSQPFWSIGDIDGDGRDEAVEGGVVYELVGAPPASIVRDRGACGATSGLSRPRIRHRLRPAVGGTLLVHLQGGIGGGLVFLAFGTAADVDLGPIGAPGNRAYLVPIASIGRVTDAYGLAAQNLQVPNTPAFVGVALSLQWAVLDPAANPLGLATSNALDFVIGN